MINVYWYIAYAIWAVINLYDLLYTEEKVCKKWLASNLIELNYEAVVVFGIFPAFLCFVIMGLLCIAAPFIILMFYRNRQAEMAHVNRTKRLIKSMVRQKWNQQLFKNADQACIVCLIDFDQDSEVTPLPCDVRHYFHTHCIEEWFRQ